MDARELRSGIAELNDLAEKEYGAGLSKILSGDDGVSASPSLKPSAQVSMCAT
jgi:hypothetical protein